jgi:hypothetical protein
MPVILSLWPNTLAFSRRTKKSNRSAGLRLTLKSSRPESLAVTLAMQQRGDNLIGHHVDCPVVP